MSLHYMLDTNICIYIAKNKPESVAYKFSTLKAGEVCMSIVTHGELLYGAQKSHSKQQTLLILNQLITLIEPLTFTANVAEYYAELRAKLEKKGRPIGNNDLWIAAHALSSGLALVTNNLQEFSRIPGLKTENWI